MVRAEIVAIGSELVLGGVADTNSLYLAEELLKLGIEVRYKTVVGDDSKDMEAALQHALGRADVVITTGGLGPTEDDLTRNVVARGTGRRLVVHDETLHRITQQLESRRRRLRTFGLGESEMDARLRDLYTAERNAVLGLQAGIYGVDVSLTVRGRDPDSAEAVMRRMERAVRDRVGDYLYGAGDQTMEGVVALKLKAKGLTVAVAESCTGGLISQRLTSVPGSSTYFDRAVVPYSDRAKVDLLKVSEALIRTKGAVSGEVAQAMAEGVRERSGADLGLAVTGIAGPTGGTKEKPVGLVYLALADKKTAVVRSQLFSGDRDGIRGRASQAVLDLLRRYLSGKETG